MIGLVNEKHHTGEGESQIVFKRHLQLFIEACMHVLRIVFVVLSSEMLSRGYVCKRKTKVKEGSTTCHLSVSSFLYLSH
jgi:hypothetical protein